MSQINIDFKKDCDISEIPKSKIVILFGKNNSGKTLLLSRWRRFVLIGRKLDSKNIDNYIGPSRYFIQDKPLNGGEKISNGFRKIRGFNGNLKTNFQIIKDYETQKIDTLGKIQELSDSSFLKLKEWYNKLGFGVININRDSKNVLSIDENTFINNEGSGSKALLNLIIYLFNDNTDTIFIDEPEISLESQNQKKLFELIKKVSKGEDGLPKKKIILATHSNLFLDKKDHNNNWNIKRVDAGKITLKNITNEEELLKTSFEMLGTSPADIFFPNNILIVEGHSDKIFIEKLLKLKYPESNIAIHYSDGDSKIEYAINAIDQMLKTVSYLSLYRERICVLIDKGYPEKLINKWREFLRDTKQDRVIELDKNGIEYFYPKSILVELTGFSERKLDFEIEKFLDESKKNGKDDEEKYGAVFGNLGFILKTNLAQEVVNKLNKENLKEVDKKIIDLVEKCISLRWH